MEPLSNISYNEIDDSSKPYAINIDELIVLINDHAPSYPSSVDIVQKDIENALKKTNEELASYDPLYFIDWLCEKYIADIKENNLFIDRFNNAKDDHSLGIQSFQSQNVGLDFLLEALDKYRKILESRKNFEAKELEKVMRRINRKRGSNINDSYFILDLVSEGFDTLGSVKKAHSSGISTKDIINYINLNQSVPYTFAILYTVGFLEMYMKKHHLNKKDFIDKTQSWFTRQYALSTLSKPISYYLNVERNVNNYEYNSPLIQSKVFLGEKKTPLD